MRSTKRISLFFFSVIVFSFVVSLLPGLAAFAATDPYKVGYDTNNVAGSLPKKIGTFLANQESAEYDSFTDGYDLQKDETAALKEYWKRDLCDRTSDAGDGGIGHPTFLGLLFKLVGDSPSSNIKEATVSYEASQIKPEMVPHTDYDCFPPGWEDVYSEAAWHNYQRAVGTFSCGRFDVTCAIEKALRQWISDGIKTGLTWIMNIATGSGSGGDFQACRVGSGQDVNIDDRGGAPVGKTGGYTADPNGTVDKEIDAGFTQEQMANCDAALNTYYALDNVGTPKSGNGDGQLVAIGLKGETPGADGRFDTPPEVGSGIMTVNSKGTLDFFDKSKNIGIIIAVGMLVGAVIQTMVQQKPQLLFRVILIQLPLFGISLLALPVLTKNFMAFIDGVSYYLADNSQRDIQRVALSIGVNVGDAIANNTEATAVGAGAVGAGGAALAAQWAGISVAGAPLMASIMQGSLIVLGLIGVAFLIQALGLWALMQFREASIVLVFAVIPLSMSASIWPTLTRTANKFIKLLASLIVAKIPIVLALSMGLHFLGEWAKGKVAETADALEKVNTASTMANIPQGGNRVLIMGMAIFALAFLAPTFVITLFDAVGEMGGSLASRMHSGAGRSGLMYASQAAGLKGMPGMLTGNKVAKAKAAKAQAGGSRAGNGGVVPGANPEKKGRFGTEGSVSKDGTRTGDSVAGGRAAPDGPQGARPSASRDTSSSTSSSSSSTRSSSGGAGQGPQGARGWEGKDGKDGKDAGDPSNPWSNKTGPTKGGKLS